MFCKEYLPHKALRNYIHSYFYFRNDFKDPHAKNMFCLPSGGGSDIVINIGDPICSGIEPEKLERIHGGRVLGTLSRNLSIKVAEQTSYLVVRFLPGKMSSFFKIPAYELSDMNIELEWIWGSGKILEDRIMNSSAIQEIAMFLDDAFLKLLPSLNPNDYRINEAIRTISCCKGQISITDTAKHIDLSPRQLERRFMELVGITPKRFCRIIRFRSVFTYLQNSRQKEWAEVAAACGYSDQAHLIRECKFFTGYSPAAYLNNLSPLERAVLKVDNSVAYQIHQIPELQIPNKFQIPNLQISNPK